MIAYLSHNKKNLLFASAVATLFFIYNFALISNGHFQEDAYILFIYVENFLKGNGISFYPGGPHAEGATDFLWMILLIFFGKLGFDTGTSVIILNSISVFIICFLLSVEIFSFKIKDRIILIFFYPFLVLWIFQQPLIAAASGFSVFLYMALTLLAFITVYKEKYILYTPYISLIIALFRPDAVPIGLGFTFIGLGIAYKNHHVKKYAIGIIFSLSVGIFYFVWRYNYFGNLFPLPFYVKVGRSFTPGLRDNFLWLIKNLHLLMPVFFLSIINKKWRHLLLIASPVILHFLAFIAVTQSQNIGYRFQGPILIIAYYILVVLMIEYIKKHHITKLAKMIIYIYLLGVFILGLRVLYQTRTIVNMGNILFQAPLAINSNLPAQQTIILTEAGNMAYWNQSGNHKIIDIVGLNSEYPAKNTINVKYIEGQSPDVIMYTHLQLLDVSWLNKSNKKVILLTDTDKNHLVNKLHWTEKERASVKKRFNASYVATEYLQKHFAEYDIFLVSYYDRTYPHVYAFKKKLNLKEKMLKVLNNSVRFETTLSYYDMLDIKHGQNAK